MPIAILNALIVLINLGHLMFNPIVRPGNVARSLAGSKKIVSSRE
jgi:hypothetical protein